MQLIFATNNQHKIEEIRSVLPQSLNIITLKEAGIDIDIPEPFDTLEENAMEKAKVIFNLTKTSCFSEDTGLEVASLNGEPGVHSARYAGDERSSQKNLDKLLAKLENNTNRNAQFKTVICLLWQGNQHLFDGICKGHIITEIKGREGFGYDPVFVPDGADKTFGEMNIKEKSKYSHRRKALDKLVAFLNNIGQIQ